MQAQIKNLEELLIEQVRELYNAEKQQRSALEKLESLANNRQLRLAIKNHLDETEQQIKRLENVCGKLGISSYGEQSEATRAIIAKGEFLIDRCSDPEILDAAIVTSLQYLEHLEIAGYGSACTYARELGLDEVEEQLHLSLVEEKEIDSQLSDIATESINEKAKTPIIV